MKLPTALLLLPALFLVTPASAQLSMKVEDRVHGGRQREIIVMENARVKVEIVPSDAGRIITYRDKTRDITGFEWLDDCPYHYGCRWEGQPFEYSLGENTPDKVSATVKGGGKIAVGILKSVTGVSIANPLEIEITRTMTLAKDSSRLLVEVTCANVGEGVAPNFRYMMHGVWGGIAREPFAFVLPTEKGAEFFNSSRGREVFRSTGTVTRDPNHPFNRFTPGVRADKPRYAPMGWAALLTAAGPNYVEYDPEQFDFFQFWYGGDGSWHWTSEPQTRPVNLEPGQSVSFWFALACDAAHINFSGPTVAYGDVKAPAEAAPGTVVEMSLTSTTARNDPETARVNFAVKRPDGSELGRKSATAEVRGFQFAELKTGFNLPANTPLGVYTWTAAGADGRQIGAGEFEVLTNEDAARRASERAVAQAKAASEKRIAELVKSEAELKRESARWRPAANLLVNLRNPAAWESRDDNTPVSFRVIDNATPVFGDWSKTEAIRVKAYRPAPAPAFNSNIVERLAALGADAALVADAAQSPDGEWFAALLVDAKKPSVQIAVAGADGKLRRIGRYAEKPTEESDQLGKNTRAVAVDNGGNVWVATTVWGMTSRYVAGPDGQPSEVSDAGYKGAVKVFTPAGVLKAVTPALDTPTDLVPALADGLAVMLAPYRNVSAYHGAMVREGVTLLDAETGARLGELKVPSGSVAIDGTGGVWASDVAGHVSRHTAGGRRLADIAETPAKAVKDAVLPELAPLPMILRTAADGSLWALRPMQRELLHLTDKAGLYSVEKTAIPANFGKIVTLMMDGDEPVVVGQKEIRKLGIRN